MPQPNELYINDVLSDLSDSSPIALTLQVNDLANIVDRQSTFSNTLKLPKTAQNLQSFGWPNSDAFTQDQPYDLLRADLRQFGIPVITAGKITLLRVTDFLETQLTAGLSGFLDLLKKQTFDNTGRLISTDDVKLADLEWTDIPDYTWDLPTVVASQTNQNPLLPVIDYGGTLDSSSSINSTFLRPGIYFQQIFDRIQRFTGYKFYGGHWFTDGFDDFIPISTNNLIDYQGNEYWNSNNSNMAIQLSRNIPDITVKDLLKDYMQRYFLTPVVDNYNKTITFRSFDELYLNFGKAKDWSSKFLNESREDSFSLANYAQSNYFLWKKDSQTPFLLNYPTGVININNKNLDLSRTLVTSIFSASDMVTAVGGHRIASIRKFDPPPVGFGNQPIIDTEYRVVKIKSVPGTFSFTGPDTIQITNLGIKIGQFNDWNWYIDNYGQGLLKMLAKCRAITRSVNLNPTDLKDFDFFTPVFDGNDGKYYYVNKIPNYIPGKKTQVSLIRL